VLTPARIRYQDDQPYSLDFEDIYHAADGAAEVRRVFLEPCRIAGLATERAGHPHPAMAVVRIGELGFGSGLNFVMAAEACLAAGARLQFVSCESRPLSAADFAGIAGTRRAAHPLYAELLEAWPPPLSGWHRRSLAGGRVQLMLWLGEAAEALQDLQGRQRQPLDAWFLDGFAPDRNADLWADTLLQAIGKLSGTGTRVATFTAAGRVRRGLTAAGFAMRRVDQRPHKRETLAGEFAGTGGLRAFEAPRRVTIVGGGLAGASAAWHLAEAGIAAQLVDAPDPPADRPPGSRMPATVLHARLLADAGTEAGLRCHTYLYAAARARGLDGFRLDGALQLPGERAAAARLRAVAARFAGSGDWLAWLEAPAAAALAGWPADHGGLLLRDAGAVDLPVLVRGMLARAGVTPVRRMLTSLPEDGVVVLACGAAVREFAPARYLEVAPVYGQLDVVDCSERPRLPLVGSHYLVPCADGLAAGSTYEHRPWAPAAASAANLAQLGNLSHTWRYRCRGTRSVSSDRTAIAGPLFEPDGSASERLFVSTGHGSAGNVSAHLAGAVLAARLSGDCPPLAAPLEAALSSYRFRARQARRGFRHGARP
jgi:tRNA 5-methylaminomethyl-2-thiouridine biosynthesis bifunctional protein